MGILKGAVKFRGKLNDVVGFKNGNAASEATLFGVRNLQTSVSNPQTVGQIDQRMKLPAAQNFYRALAFILDHSWQGMKYGARSYAKFLQLAMTMQSGFPYVEKGEKTPWPGKFQVSMGGLSSIPYAFGGNENNTLRLSTSDGFEAFTTVGDLSAQLLEAYPQLSEGDQLTFILCVQLNGEPLYVTARFVIDSESTATIADWEASQGIQLDFNSAGNTIDITTPYDAATIAAAIIVSRPPRNAGGAWQRSNTTMIVTAAYESSMLSATLLAGVRASYKKQVSASFNSDWYLNQGNEANGGNGSTTQRSLVAGTYDGKSGVLFYVVGNQSRLVVDENAAGGHYYIDFDSNAMTAKYNSLTALTAAVDVPVVLLSTVQNYFPSLTVSEKQNAPIEDNP